MDTSADDRGGSRRRTVSSSSQRPDPLFSLPHNQPLYRYYEHHKSWLPLQPPLPSPNQTFTNFQVLTWNIEFSSPLIFQRTRAILDHIETQLLTAQNFGNPTIILFQEVHEDAFPAFLSHPFLQAYYDLTDISCAKFVSHYGTVSLIPRILSPFVRSITRVPFKSSRMGRDALTIDLDLPRYPDFPHSFPSRLSTVRVRVANTHLESLRGAGDAARPQQLKAISRLLSAVHGGIVGGDMNAIGPADPQLPQTVSLYDCWEMLRPRATRAEGCTWGYQSRPNSPYPPARLDKVLISGGLRPIFIERFGIGQYLGERRKKIWLSDHYGLLCQVMID